MPSYFLGIGPFLGLSGVWRVSPFMGSVSARSHVANIGNKTPSAHKLWSGSNGDLRESGPFGNPRSAIEKKLSQSITRAFRPGPAPSEIPICSEIPFFSLCPSYFLARPPATSSSFQSACRNLPEPRTHGKEPSQLQVAGSGEIFVNGRLETERKRSPEAPDSFPKAAGHPCPKPLEPLVSLDFF